MKINWKQKLSSRKFWAAVLAWLTSMLGAFRFGEDATAQVLVIVAGIGSLTVYMLAEARVDAGRKPDTQKPDTEEEKPYD